MQTRLVDALQSKTLWESEEDAEDLPNVKIAYVNAMSQPDPNAVLRSVLQQLNPSKDLSKLRADQVVDMLRRRLVPSTSRKASTMTVVVIDEMDALLQRTPARRPGSSSSSSSSSEGSCGASHKTLYQLLEWPSRPGSTCVLVGIANAIDLVQRHLPALKSAGCAPELVVFSPYRQEQLTHILRQRLAEAAQAASAWVGRVGLVGGSTSPVAGAPGGTQRGSIMEASAEELCARKVAAASGDARRVLALAKQAIVDALQPFGGPHCEAESEGRDTIQRLAETCAKEHSDESRPAPTTPTKPRGRAVATSRDSRCSTPRALAANPCETGDSGREGTLSSRCTPPRRLSARSSPVRQSPDTPPVTPGRTCPPRRAASLARKRLAMDAVDDADLADASPSKRHCSNGDSDAGDGLQLSLSLAARFAQVAAGSEPSGEPSGESSGDSEAAAISVGGPTGASPRAPKSLTRGTEDAHVEWVVGKEATATSAARREAVESDTGSGCRSASTETVPEGPPAMEHASISLGTVAKSLSRATESPYIPAIRSLPQHGQILVLAATLLGRAAKASNRRAITVGLLQERYTKLCRRRLLSPVATAEFPDLLSRLAEGGLLTLAAFRNRPGKSTRDRTVRVNVTCDDVLFALEDSPLAQRLQLDSLLVS